MLRQQVLIVGRKKDQFAENLKDLRSEHTTLEKQLKEKRKNMIGRERERQKLFCEMLIMKKEKTESKDLPQNGDLK